MKRPYRARFPSTTAGFSFSATAGLARTGLGSAWVRGPEPGPSAEFTPEPVEQEDQLVLAELPGALIRLVEDDGGRLLLPLRQVAGQSEQVARLELEGVRQLRQTLTAGQAGTGLPP